MWIGAKRKGSLGAKHASKHACTTSNSMLVTAAQKGELATVELLLRRGAHPDSEKGGVHGDHSALHVAAAYKHEAVVKMLLRVKAQVDKPTSGGMRPLHFAAVSGSVGIIELLIEHRADPIAADSHGRTAAWLAKATRQIEAHKKLAAACKQALDPRPPRPIQRPSGGSDRRGYVADETRSGYVADETRWPRPWRPWRRLLDRE